MKKNTYICIITTGTTKTSFLKRHSIKMRYFIFLSYDGERYHGWQIQPNGISVQETLNKSLSRLLQSDIEVVGAGRTDAGVHAKMMAAHFDYELADNEDAQEKGKWICQRLNRMLPQDIAIDRVAGVAPDAHARFSALSRTYNYIISDRKNPFTRKYVCHIPQSLDYSQMNAACRMLKEYTDFTSFSKLHTDVKTNDCTITQAVWTHTGPHEWTFTIRANRFLRNMVRAIVGTLVDVGLHRITLDDFRAIIESKDRCNAGMSMPAHALYLVNIEYPDAIYHPVD